MRRKIPYDGEQIANILLGERQTSTFLTPLAKERPLDGVDPYDKPSDVPLSEALREVEY